MSNNYICRFCSSTFSSERGCKYHAIFCSSNPDRKSQWNSGKTKDTDESVLKMAESLTGREHICRPFVRYCPGHTGKANTEQKEIERKRKLSEWAKVSGNGGYKPGSGRGKKGWYKGFFCDSSWELAFLVYNLDHNVSISRCKEVRHYEHNGRNKKYYPDFVVDNKIIEIKGYKTAEVESKLNANTDIICLYEADIKPYLSYVIDKYGKDFVRLYETTDD